MELHHEDHESSASLLLFRQHGETTRLLPPLALLSQTNNERDLSFVTNHVSYKQTHNTQVISTQTSSEYGGIVVVVHNHNVQLVDLDQVHSSGRFRSDLLS